MTTYYVATLARYVLVEADSPAQARELGHPALSELSVAESASLKPLIPPVIRTVRLASVDEIDTMRWHQATLVREAAQK